MSRSIAEALAARLRGAMPANVALMQLLMEAPSRAAAEDALALVPMLDPALATAAETVTRLLLPYLVGAGLADRHIGEIGRVLRPGGAAVILNYSYRGDPARDLGELTASAEARGLAVTAPSPSGFRLWDAAVYRVVKPGE